MPFRLLYPKAIWKIEGSSKKIYLTFDDGPIPDLTEWVLDKLKEYQAKATFFCVGENILKHPDIFQRIINEGHQVGNHSQTHLKGFKTKTTDYLRDVAICEDLTKTKLFRPPYGQLKVSQYKQLLQTNYKIIMWDVISYDYEKISPMACFSNIKQHAKEGSILLFHDNWKAETNMKFALVKTLEHFFNLNYSFVTLPL